MSAIVPHDAAADASYMGLRLTSEEFFALADDGRKYELVDGVLLGSPGPTPRHQLTAAEVLDQLRRHVSRQRLGVVLYETDVLLGCRVREPGCPRIHARPGRRPGGVPRLAALTRSRAVR
ncbi:MAG: Uma2 family endonuclease [Phycisphaerales bacterium]|nr:Uma2 family endonuclease [Phycisphaerales bacterium]